MVTATATVGGNGFPFTWRTTAVITALDLLLAADARTADGPLDHSDTAWRNQANTDFSAVNQAGAVG